MKEERSSLRRLALVTSVAAIALVALPACPGPDPEPGDTSDAAAETDAVADDTAKPEAQRVTVFVNGTGLGTVTSDPPGIDCGTTCSADFDYGVTVTLTAVPALSNAFGGFGGGLCEGLKPCQVVVTAAADIAVTWNPNSLAVASAGVVTPTEGTTGDDRLNALAPSSFGTVYAAQSGTSSTLLRLNDLNGAPEVMWSRRFGPPAATCPDLVLTTDNGARAFIAGAGAAGTDLNPNDTAVDGTGTFLSAYSDDGSWAWSQVVTAGCPKAISASQTVVAWTGEVSGAGAAIDQPLGTNDNATSVVIGVHDASTGAPIWSRALATADFDAAAGRAIALDPFGGVVVAARMTSLGTIDLGGGALPTGAPMVVARFDETGVHLWSRTYGGIDHDISALRLLADGNIVIVGAQRVVADDIAFVTKLDGDNGSTLWTATYQYAPQHGPTDLVATSDGGVIVAGWRYIPTDGLSNITLTRIGAAGGLMWRQELGSQGGEERALAIARGDNGWWLGGWFSGSSPWQANGTDPLSAVDGADSFLLKFDESAQ